MQMLRNLIYFTQEVAFSLPILAYKELRSDSGPESLDNTWTNKSLTLYVRGFFQATLCCFACLSCMMKAFATSIFSNARPERCSGGTTHVQNRISLSLHDRKHSHQGLPALALTKTVLPLTLQANASQQFSV